MNTAPTIVSASFDNVQSRQIRLLEEAAPRGPVHVLLWDDALVEQLTGSPPKFPQQERRYFIEAVRWVDRLSTISQFDHADTLPAEHVTTPARWIVDAASDTPEKRTFAGQHGLDFEAIPESTLEQIPASPEPQPRDGDPSTRVMVTGCYDWLHSGHVRFFEEVSELGQLYVIVGHDENIRLLKGDSHPMFPATVRRYMVGAIRYVHQALVSTGHGWLDAEPEVEHFRPDIYAVNEDGDRPEKREFCQRHGIEYRILKRSPKAGLPRRESTALRGF